jgi:hypothetical protein
MENTLCFIVKCTWEKSFFLYIFFFLKNPDNLMIFQNWHNAKPINLFQTNRKIMLSCKADIRIEDCGLLTIPYL